MSVNSSKLKQAKWWGLAKDFAGRTFLTVGYSTWVVFSIYVVGFLAVAWLPKITKFAVGDVINWANPATQMIASLLVYVIGIAVLMIEPAKLRRMSRAKIRSLLGISKKIRLSHVGYALIGWGAYLILTVIVQAIASSLLTGIDFEQKQDIGFSAVSGIFEVLVTFLAIVVAVPIIEEVVFRGYFYGSLRPKMSWWLASIIVGAVFGAAHGQWNVAFDTFVMSMVACYLREKTGSIWAGIFLHGFKNALAFSILFLFPEFLRNLLVNS